MKYITKASAIGSTLAVAGMLALSGQAVADTVEATYNEFKKTRNVQYNLGGAGFQGTVGGYASFEGKNNDGLGLSPFGDNAFIGFCVDLGDLIGGGGGPGSGPFTFDVISLDEAPDPVGDQFMGTTKANRLARMFATYLPDFSNAGTLNRDEAAGMQIAVWEIIYEDDENGATNYDLDDGNIKFRNFGGSAKDKAEDYLDVDNWVADGLTNLKALSLPSNGSGSTLEVQDFVVQVVPIPAAAWLFGSAMVGAVALGRRKKKAEAAA